MLFRAGYFSRSEIQRGLYFVYFPALVLTDATTLGMLDRPEIRSGQVFETLD